MPAPIYVYTPQPALITEEQATDKLHLTLSDVEPETQRHLTLQIMATSDQIREYLKSANDPTWNPTTAPPIVQAAVLARLAVVWEHRGDDDIAAQDFDAENWRLITRMLMQLRDPALA